MAIGVAWPLNHQLFTGFRGIISQALQDRWLCGVIGILVITNNLFDRF